MHFNKRGSNDNNMNLLTSSSPSHLAASTLSSSSSSSSPNSSSSASKTKTTTTHGGLSLGLWWLLLMTVILMAQQQPCECRYLPTRSHGDDLDKLRELMLQILESSNEDGGVQQRPPNEANGNTLAAAAQRANWLNKLGGNMDNMDVPRKYNAPRGIYDNGRYY
ncbi:uncharacterized protein LOC119599739 [Lucilia sericata]|uniref:uncharacterized protein LOC119599739 n=1 Tax=Lucilia sericata TaxID=13632 RepID=UPI0018A80E58|nr:uncharacterized protein LOC119599739 [Lucilia sericata]XP_037805569.1 uncharacterized protein LOC119599739 [Lucilia sericata]